MMPPKRTRVEEFLALLLVLAFPAAGCSRSHASAKPETEPAALVAGKDAAATTASGTGKPFGAPCVADGECAAGACFHKHVHDLHGAAEAGHEHRVEKGENDAVQADGYCSLRCSDDGDCPVPPTAGRCGGRGMCKQ